MNQLLYDYHLSLDCPKCSHKFKEKYGRLLDLDSIICPSCGASIKLEKSEMLQTHKQMEEAFEHIGRLTHELIEVSKRRD